LMRVYVLDRAYELKLPPLFL